MSIAENAFKAVALYMFDNIYNATLKEFRSNIALTLLRERSFKYSLAVGTMTITLPDAPTDRYFAYMAKREDLNNVPGVITEWVDLETLLNDHNIRVDLMSEGRMVPKLSAYIKNVTPDTFAIVVSKKMLESIGGDHTQVYADVWVDSTVNDNITQVSHVPIYNEDYSGILVSFGAVSDYSKIKCYVNGMYVDSDKFLQFAKEDVPIEIVRDDNVSHKFDINIDAPYTYTSTTEQLIKTIVHLDKSIVGDKLVTYNSLEMYVVRAAGDGLMLPFHSPTSVSQLLSSTFGITSSLIDNLRLALVDDQVKLVVYWSQYEKDNRLLPNGYFGERLFATESDLEIQQHLSDEVLTPLSHWSGDYLEYHPYNLAMFDAVRYDEFSPDNLKAQIKALGYHNFLKLVAAPFGEIQTNSFGSGVTSLSQLTIDKPVVFHGRNVDVDLYLNGLLLLPGSYTTVDYEKSVDINFNAPITFPENSVIMYKIVPERGMRAYTFTPDLNNYTMTINGEEELFFYAKITGVDMLSADGTNRTHGWEYIDHATSTLITVVSTGTDHTIMFDQILFGREILIFNGEKTYSMIINDLDVSDGATIILEPRVRLQGSTATVPMLIGNTFDIYLNGKRLFDGIDFTIKRTYDPVNTGVLGEVQIVVANHKYLEEPENTFVVQATNEAIDQRDTGFFIDNTIPITNNNSLFVEGVSRLFVNGVLESYDAIGVNYENYGTESKAHGSAYMIETPVNQIVKQEFVPYEDINYWTIVNDTTTYYTQNSTPPNLPVTIVPSIHYLYSAYLNTIIRKILDGSIPVTYVTTDAGITDQLIAFEYLKEFDILHVPNTIDFDFVDVYPAYVSTYATDDVEKYLFINRLVAIYLGTDAVHGSHVVYTQ